MQKRITAYHYIGLILTGVSLVPNVGGLIDYFSNTRISKAYQNPIYILYISFPILLITATLLIYILFIKNKSRIDRVFIYTWIFHILLILGIWKFYRYESNKIYIEVVNLSKRNYISLEIKTRNNQRFIKEEFNSGDTVSFLCHCRRITFVDTLGIQLSLNPGQEFHKEINANFSNTSYYRDTLVVQIINDTLSFVSENFENRWIRSEKYDRLFETKELEQIKRSINQGP